MDTRTTPLTLCVVTHARWMADDLGSAGVLPVIQDFGLGDLPENPALTAWWCPQNYAARLLASGVDPYFQSQGHDFLWRARTWHVRRLAQSNRA